MNSRLILHAVTALLILTPAARSAPVSLTVNSNGGSPYADSLGNLLATGSVIRIGQFDLSLPGNLTLLQTSNDYIALDALFTPLAESLPDAGTVLQTGAPGQQIVINDLFSAGDVFGQIINIEDTYFTANTPLYAWVFNNANPAAATEWGIFSNSTNLWNFPISPGSEALSTFEINDVVRGFNTGTQFQLSPVPEPGSLVLVMAAAGVFAFFRFRTTTRPGSALA